VAAVATYCCPLPLLLLQVVNDPWDVQLLDGAAADFAWVSKVELGQYITDQKLLALAHKML
jgi:hypothetical protein